ncbi:hypothetical protein [Mangrovibacter phragmitis]|uniref:hypothetical protein n=1 Tax=Mangrovibacter phragmitis TaxID=1691903 RepID=UPI0035170DF3
MEAVKTFMMKQVENVSLRMVRAPVPEKNKDGEYEVLIDEQPTGITVPYCDIEAAVKVDADRYLLFLTNDTLFEEMLRIALIRPGEGVIDMLVVGAPYSTGIFEELDVQKTAVNFRFIGDTTWTVSIPKKPFFRIPFIGDPPCVWHSFTLKCYIRISANPPKWQ